MTALSALVPHHPGEALRTHLERLPFWPFRHEELEEDLRAAGLTPRGSGYAPQAGRYGLMAER